jgi:hypothetical protein
MNTNQNKLALRRQSIRTLAADELRMAHAGEGTATAPAVAMARTPSTPLCPPPEPTVRR